MTPVAVRVFTPSLVIDGHARVDDHETIANFFTLFSASPEYMFWFVMRDAEVYGLIDGTVERVPWIGVSHQRFIGAFVKDDAAAAAGLEKLEGTRTRVAATIVSGPYEIVGTLLLKENSRPPTDPDGDGYWSVYEQILPVAEAHIRCALPGAVVTEDSAPLAFVGGFAAVEAISPR